MRPGLIAALLLASLGNPASADDRTALRVCADPSNLPYSNEAGEGFENRIAEVLGQALGLPVTYAWHPRTIGFVRNTLNSGLCDLVMGVTTGSEILATTPAYYRSSDVLAYRAGDEARSGVVRDLQDRPGRIGVVAGTPPATYLARAQLLGRVEPYALVVDTRHFSPARQMIIDLAEGKIDTALVWGPIAGYWAARQEVPIELVPMVEDEMGPPVRFSISMGVRYRDREWKDEIARIALEHRDDIHAVLEEFGVPLE